MRKQRGLTAEQVRYITDHKELHELIKREDLFFGVRNEYFNLYYRCASVGKFTSLKGDSPCVETDKKYLGAGSKLMDLKTFRERYESILEGIVRVQGKGCREKIAQQALVLANNRNMDSKWYCVDLEYVQQREDGSESQFGRFDIVAVSKAAGKEGRHRVALIELKVGYKTCYFSDFPEWIQKQIDGQLFSIYDYKGSLGSGIVGHLADFCRFEQSGQFEKLRAEVCTILSNKRALGFDVPCPELCPQDLEEQPHFYFLTLSRDDSSESIASCKNSMYHYLGIKGHGGLAAYHAKRALGDTFLERENYHFLFAPGGMCGRETLDILGEPDIEWLK